ncbi:MAG: hypothetical protein NTU44_13900 [Bacteroidetes bacterium]|nr:hypothetical protein [Bacteroidota bacterium]
MKDNRLLLVFFFALGMGLLETIVVVYLRQIYYPAGFDFPMVLFSPKLFGIELLREAATLVMLVTVGMLAGKSRMQQFAYFLYAFAVWDIVYYLGLKGLLDWPSGLLTWDILFLIPVVWVGPVLAPVICSVTMIGLAVEILWLEEKGRKPVINRLNWSLIVLGAALILLTFIWDYSAILVHGGFLGKLNSLSTDKAFRDIISSYKPLYYNWLLFTAGELLIVAGMVRMLLFSSKNPVRVSP